MIKIEAAMRLKHHSPEERQTEQLREEKKRATPEDKANIQIKMDRLKLNKDQKHKTDLVNKLNKEG